MNFSSQMHHTCILFYAVILVLNKTLLNDNVLKVNTLGRLQKKKTHQQTLLYTLTDSLQDRSINNKKTLNSNVKRILTINKQ